MKKIYCVAVVVLLSLISIKPVNATESWPAEPWTQSTVLTSLDSDFQNNLSGASWNDTTGTLWVCLNGPGRFWALVEDGYGSFKIDTYNGRVAEWSIPGDIESIAQVDLKEASVYVMDESQDRIRKYDTSVYGSPVLLREWNITGYVPAYSGGAGSEGIAFVPDKWLRLNGFVDMNGQPYVSQNGMGGLIFVAHQRGGALYAFDLFPDSNELSFVGSYKTSRSESSGLEFDRSSGKLYIWHNTGGNFLEVTDLTSYVGSDNLRHFTTVKEYYAPKGGNLEGFALTQASSGKNWFFTTDDDNQNGAALMWFKDFVPSLLGSDTFSVYEDTTLTVPLPGLLENDLGTDTLIVVEEPLHGTLDGLSVGGTFNGSFDYIPDEDYAGPDEFRYSASGGSEVAKVIIDIRPVKKIIQPISNSMDDVEERADGSMYTNSSDLELVEEKSVQTVGLRFNSLGLPSGSEVLRAYVQFTTDEATSAATTLTIHGESSADASPFTTASNNVSGRVRTASSVEWVPEAWNSVNESGIDQKTFNIASIVQEIIDSPDWQIGNSLVLIIEGTGKRVARSFDKSPSLSPRLIVEYVEPEGQQVGPSISRVETQVSSSIDDVEERADGYISTNSTDLELVTESTVQTVGIRFNFVEVPEGAEITNAYIQFTVDETSSVATELMVIGEASSDPQSFGTNSYNVSSRQKTTAAVSWSPEAWDVVGEVGVKQRTPDISSVVQEMIDVSGWSGGKAMVFIITGSGKRIAESFDGSQATAPRLIIEYIEPEDVRDLPSISIVETRISSSMDDVEEKEDGYIYTDSSDLELVEDGAVQTVGVRFGSVDIPAGAEIADAYIQFTVDEVSIEPSSLAIFGEASSGSPAFNGDYYNVSSRTKTLSQVSWSPGAWSVVGEVGDVQRTPDLSGVIQEIISDPNWNAGNSMSFIITGSGRRTAESCDGSKALAPLLHVEYVK